MKKTISILICIFITVSGLFAIKQGSYMMSYAGTYAIPMDSPAYREVTETSKWVDGDMVFGDKSGAIPHDAFRDALIDKNANAIGNYSDYNMISIGGYAAVSLKDPSDQNKTFDSVMLRMSVESPAGLNFISLSHPNITRPYGVAAFPLLKSKEGTGSFKPSGSTMAVFKNSGDTFDFIFKNANRNGLDANKVMHEIWYDMVLILPGQWDGKSKSLADSKNKINIAGATYELVPADDYSSVVNIRMELFGGYNGANFVPLEAPQILSVPISGYYHEGAASRDENVSFGMHIMPNNNCANLNINQQQGKLVKIADINLLSKNVDTSGINAMPKEPLYKGEKPTDPGPAHSEIFVPYPEETNDKIGELTSPPAIGYKGYFVGGWPKYGGFKMNWNDDFIQPIPSWEPKPGNYWGGKNDEEYIRDHQIWQSMKDKTNPGYNKYLENTRLWDEYMVSDRRKEWENQTDVWNKHQQWEKDMLNWSNNATNDMFVFFSSNQDPMALNPEPFMLVHESKPGDTPLNSRNHIKFTLVAYDKQDKSTKSFDGTTYFDPMGDTSQFDKFIQTHDFSIKGKEVDFHGKDQNNRKYEGEIYLVMENKPDQIMIRGKYTEKIFVHVISSR